VLVDIKKKETNSTSLSIIYTTSLNGEDTIAKNQIIYQGKNPNIDSIVKVEKSKAMNSLSSKYLSECKKPCCMGCRATDTVGLALVCLSDHSCCNPSFK
jgi:hypothetical protein